MNSITYPKPLSSSLALRRAGEFDHADVIAIPLPPGLPTDAGWWTRRVFSPAGAPAWVGALLATRQALVPVLGLKPAPNDVFTVREESDDEALVAFPDKHLDFWCSIGVERAEAAAPHENAEQVTVAGDLLRMTTVVRLHGWRGKAYWAVVSFFHQPVSAAMMRGARSNRSRYSGVSSG